MIIGITGKKYHGKDMLADYLVSLGFIKYSMANPLKSGLKEFFGFNEKQVNGEEKEIIDPEWGVSPRQVMQFFGTEVMQLKIQELIPNIERNFFVKRFNKFCQVNKGKNIVVADIRFQHEINFIKNNNGIIIKTFRSNANTENHNEHISEAGIDKLIGIDFEIQNNSSPEVAFQRLNEIVEENVE
ncbi:hypothetical protein CPAV1605_885 [seawater metagenome]|uniref:Deoxynucleotide monophosphate kinase n=1 Tax=seawater metagenome TaxID=1561972 RepID=A0A5E8CME4_9ZZZZ